MTKTMVTAIIMSMDIATTMDMNKDMDTVTTMDMGMDTAMVWIILVTESSKEYLKRFRTITNPPSSSLIFPCLPSSGAARTSQVVIRSRVFLSMVIITLLMLTNPHMAAELPNKSENNTNMRDV